MQSSTQKARPSGEKPGDASNSGTQARQLEPFVSTKSWRVMARGSTWCSRNGRMKAGPTSGVS